MLRFSRRLVLGDVDGYGPHFEMWGRDSRRSGYAPAVRTVSNHVSSCVRFGNCSRDVVCRCGIICRDVEFDVCVKLDTHVDVRKWASME